MRKIDDAAPRTILNDNNHFHRAQDLKLKKKK